MNSPPILLQKAGIDWRWALPSDLKFIVSSWFDSQFKPFMKGWGGCPWPRFASVVAEARLAGRIKLLHRIYHTEMPRMIEASLLKNPTIVAYNVDWPEHIIAWASAEYAYVQLSFRHMGIATALLGELNANLRASS